MKSRKTRAELEVFLARLDQELPVELALIAKQRDFLAR